MPKDMDFTKRIIPLFVIVMIGWVLVFSMLWYFTCHELSLASKNFFFFFFWGSLHQGRATAHH